MALLLLCSQLPAASKRHPHHRVWFDSVLTTTPPSTTTTTTTTTCGLQLLVRACVRSHRAMCRTRLPPLQRRRRARQRRSPALLPPAALRPRTAQRCAP